MPSYDKISVALLLQGFSAFVVFLLQVTAKFSCWQELFSTEMQKKCNGVAFLLQIC
jgi:hypothetical protein